MSVFSPRLFDLGTGVEDNKPDIVKVETRPANWRGKAGIRSIFQRMHFFAGSDVSVVISVKRHSGNVPAVTQVLCELINSGGGVDTVFNEGISIPSDFTTRSVHLNADGNYVYLLRFSEFSHLPSRDQNPSHRQVIATLKVFDWGSAYMFVIGAMLVALLGFVSGVAQAQCSPKTPNPITVVTPTPLPTATPTVVIASPMPSPATQSTKGSNVP